MINTRRPRVHERNLAHGSSGSHCSRACPPVSSSPPLSLSLSLRLAGAAEPFSPSPSPMTRHAALPVFASPRGRLSDFRRIFYVNIERDAGALPPPPPTTITTATTCARACHALNPFRPGCPRSCSHMLCKSRKQIRTLGKQLGAFSMVFV